MADLTPPAASEKDFDVVPADVYDAIIISVKEVPNSFYNESDPKSFPGQATQFEWNLLISDGEFQGKKYRYWTQAYISRKGNKFTRLVTAADPDYNASVGYPNGTTELQERLELKPVRITTEVQVKEYKKDDGTVEDREYSRITGFIKAKNEVDKDWLAAEVIKSQLGGNPF